MKKVILGISVIIFILLSTTCDLNSPLVDLIELKMAEDELESEEDETVSVAVSGVTLNYTSAIIYGPGNTFQLVATIVPSNATDKTLTWASGTESVATVDGNGLVTAKSLGDAAITVHTSNADVTAACNVQVSEAVTGVVDLTVSSVEPLFSSGAIAGIRMVLGNTGESAMDVLYQIFFSEDPTISKVTDVKIYEASAQIAANGEKQIDLGTETDINPYIKNNQISITGGDYYIGVIVDPNDAVNETSETNNEAVSSTTYPVEAVYLDGSVTVDLSNAEAYQGKSVYFGIAPTGTQDFEASGMGVIASNGTAGATAQNYPDGGTWTALGGAEYDLYYFIDVNGDYDPVTNNMPNNGDLTGDSVTFGPIDGDESVPLDAVNDMYISGSVRCELNFPDAAGGDIIFLVAQEGANTEDPDPTTWIEASFRTTVDGNGYAAGTLEGGVDLTEMGFENNTATGQAFYPTDGVTYMCAGAIDMGDVIWLKWNDPYDYSGFGDALPAVTFSGSQQVQLTSANFVMIEGIAVETPDFGSSEYDNFDINYVLYVPGYPEDIRGVGSILWEDRDAGDYTSVVLNTSGDHPWGDSSWDYDLALLYFVDVDDDTTLSNGDLMSEIVVSPSNGNPQTVTLSSSDLNLYLSETTYFYSDTYTPLITDTPTTSLDLYDGNTTHVVDVITLEGPALEVNFATDNTVEPNWFGMYFGRDLTFADNGGEYFVTFRMNLTSAATGLSVFDFVVWDIYGNMGGVNIMSGVDTVNPDYVLEEPSTGNGYFGLYRIPLAGVYNTIDIYNGIESIKFGYTMNPNGFFPCTIYFDDMRFEPYP